MRPLDGPGILRAWESGQGRGPLDRALVLLQVGLPDLGWDELCALSIGARDGLLLALREATFGGALRGFAECARCGERLEFSLDTASLGAPPAEAASPPAQAAPSTGEIEAGGFVVRFRLPDSRDLAAMARAGEASAAYRLLLDRCVLHAEHGGLTLRGADLPEEVAARLADRMVELDPGAEVLLDLACPACSHAWRAPLDVAAFLWVELATAARRLFRDVHALAGEYGWREADILSMSPARRQAYLDMVGA